MSFARLEEQPWTHLVLSNDHLLQHARLMLQLRTGDFASMTNTDTKGHATRVSVFDFLENVVYKPRTDDFKVTIVFKDVVDGVERFRSNMWPDESSSGSGQSDTERNFIFWLTTERGGRDPKNSL